MQAIGDELLADLTGFSGELLHCGDAAYDDARRIHNGMIDKQPSLIARCRGVADIVAVVGLARKHDLELSVRGGGHNVAGMAVTDGGAMVDLSTMRGIHVDVANRTARVQGGVRWGELDRETQLHGLAVTGGMISTTGIAGLTLGGGLGWLMGKLGLSADNLLSAQVVTADGRVLSASEQENVDLFWALRGGGGNFGVVASFEYRLHPIGPTVTGVRIAHPFSSAAEVLRFFRDFISAASDELTMNASLLHVPDGSGVKLAGVVGCHIGPREQAERELRPLLSFGSPADVLVGPMSYTAVNSLLDAGYPRGALNYWKSSFLRDLSDAAIDAIVAQFASCPSPTSSFVIEHMHGEATRVPADATAVPHREPAFNFLITSVWSDPATSEENVAWTRRAFDALQPFVAGRRYVNYLAEDEAGESPIRAAFGPNYDRLVEIKTTYDPTNLFRLNQNIRPRT